VQHIVGKILTGVTTLLETLSQLEVYTQSYGPPKVAGIPIMGILDSHLGIPRQNDIWVVTSWPATKYIIRGKVMAFPKFGPW
jgi:hypothetical protein